MATETRQQTAHRTSSSPPASRVPSSARVPSDDGNSPRSFVRTAQACDLMSHLDAETLEALIAGPPSLGDDSATQRVAIMRRYYNGPVDEAVCRAREEDDRYVLFETGKGTTGIDLIALVESRVPEVAPLSLERIGVADGPLVVRSGGDILSAVLEDEIDLDSGQVDLSELDSIPTVAVRAVMRAVNIVLDRRGVEERFVLLAADDSCECYVMVAQESALRLCSEGHMEDHDDQAVRDLGAWGRG